MGTSQEGVRLSGPCSLVAEKHTGHPVDPTGVDPTGVDPEERMMSPRANKVHFCGLGSPESSLLEDKGWSRP